MKKVKSLSTVTINRRANYDYHLGENLTVGMVLDGQQVRNIRDHHVQLKGSYVNLRHGELWLINLTLGSDTANNIKLLATKKQLQMLARAKQSGQTIVPVKLQGGSRYIKLVIATATGKKKYDKRLAIKKRDQDRYGA